MYPPHPAAAAEGIIGLAAWWHLAHLTPSIAIVRSCSSSLFVKVHKGKLVQIFWEIWHIFCHVGLQCYNAGPCHAGEMLNILTTRDCNCSLCWWVSPRECAGGKQTKPHINNMHNTIEWQWWIYLTQDRGSEIKNFTDKSLSSSSMVSLPPPLSLVPGPSGGELWPRYCCDIGTLTQLHIITPQPTPVATSTINPTPAQQSRHQIRLFYQ